MAEGKDQFRVNITTSNGTVFVDLIGEIDVVSLADFTNAIDVVLSEKPRNILFDVSGATFVCGAAYDLIGRCSLQVEHLIVCSKTGFAQKILRILGYEVVGCITDSPHADTDRAKTIHPLPERKAS